MVGLEPSLLRWKAVTLTTRLTGVPQLVTLLIINLYHQNRPRMQSTPATACPAVDASRRRKCPCGRAQRSDRNGVHRRRCDWVRPGRKIEWQRPRSTAKWAPNETCSSSAATAEQFPRSMTIFCCPRTWPPPISTGHRPIVQRKLSMHQKCVMDDKS